jgi:hypothetical protein
MKMDQTGAPARSIDLRGDEIALDQFAAQTQRALPRVTPPPEFRARLREGLRTAAHHRAAHALAVAPRPRARTPWVLLVGAALGSILGLAAILLRARRGVRPGEQAVARE